MLKNRNFLALWFVTAATTLGLELFTITVLVTIFEQTGSTLQAAGTMVARTLPAFLLGPLAGFLVDRFRRKHVLISMDLVRIALIGLAILFLSGREQLPVAAAYSLLAGLSAALVFHQPARLSLIPSFVGKDQLVTANSVILVTTQVVLAISYIAGGWLSLVLPLGQIIIGVIILFGASIIVASSMVVPKRDMREAEDEDEAFWPSVVSGWRYLRAHPIARPLTVMETIEHVPHGIWTGALMLAFTVQALNGDAADWGLQSTGYFSGMILGSVAALGLSKFLTRYPGRIIVVNAAATGLMTLAFAASPNVWTSVIIAFVFGPPFALRDVAQDSLLQGTVNAGQLGRIYATREMLRNVVFMFAGLFFAWLTAYVPVRTIYVIGGVIYLLTGLYAVSNRALRESRMTTAAAD